MRYIERNIKWDYNRKYPFKNNENFKNNFRINNRAKAWQSQLRKIYNSKPTNKTKT